MACRTVRIVCPFTPGGSQDNIARRLSAKLSEYLGQSFVVDNRTGASGSIAADNVAKSPPDGYSVLLGNIGSHALVPHLYAKPPYNPFTDLETVVWIGTQPNLLCCHPDFPHDTMPKLIAAAKAEPGKYRTAVGYRHLADARHGALQAEDRRRPHPHQLSRRRRVGGRRAGGPPAALRRQHRFADGPGERRQAETRSPRPAPSARR